MSAVATMTIPEITISPTEPWTDSQSEVTYTWKMKLREGVVLDSYDHGDVFDSIEEALANAYAEYHFLCSKQELVPANTEQEFRLTVRSTTPVPDEVPLIRPGRPYRLHLV